jgi:hypothetical protein
MTPRVAADRHIAQNLRRKARSGLSKKTEIALGKRGRECDG